MPVLGVNVGQLGYLTEVEPDGHPDGAEAVPRRSYSIEERMRLDVTVDRADGTEPSAVAALNEAVVEKSEMGHTVRLDVQLDGRAVHVLRVPTA